MWKVIGGVGASVGGIAGGGASPVNSTPPGNPSILSVTTIDTTPDASGNPQKLVTVLFAAPSPPGDFGGNYVYNDAPDSSGGLSLGDGTVPADGTTPASSNFDPTFIKFFPYNAATPQFSFVFPAPTVPQYWRLYLCGGAPGAQVFPVQFGQTGATPSFQYYVPPPAGNSTGREYAPNVTNVVLAPSSDWPAGWTSNPNITVTAAGVQQFQYMIEFDWPTADQNYASLGGVNIVLQAGALQKYPGNYAASLGTAGGQSIYIPANPIQVPLGTTAYTVYLISYDVNGNENALVTGVTPSVSFTITPTVGPSGEEYAPLVQSDGVHAFVVVTPVIGASGTALLQVDAYWKNLVPGDAGYDPRFTGAEIIVDKGDSKGPVWNIGAGTLSPIENDIQQPATVQSWIFYLVSIGVNNANTVVPGLTPSITLSVGNALGQLNLAYAQAGTFSEQLAVIAGALTITNLAASTIVTGVLQVGGNGMVPVIQVFDQFGDILAFIGQGSAVGYPSFSGLWAKQGYFGGATPAEAPVVANSSGAVSIKGSIIVGAVGSASSVPGSGVSGPVASAGFATSANSANSVPAGGIQPGTISQSVFTLLLNGITTTISNAYFGSFPAGLKISDGTFCTFADSQQFVVCEASSPASFYCSLQKVGNVGQLLLADVTGFNAPITISPGNGVQVGSNYALLTATNPRKMTAGVFQFSGSTASISTGLSAVTAVVATLATGAVDSDTVTTSAYSGGNVTFYTTSAGNPFCAWIAFGTP